MGKKVSLKSSLDVQTIAIFGNKDSTEIDAIQPNQYTISWSEFNIKPFVVFLYFFLRFF